MQLFFTFYLSKKDFSMQVLNHLLHLMRVAEKAVQRRVSLALAHLCSPDDQRIIFIDNNGMSCPQ